MKFRDAVCVVFQLPFVSATKKKNISEMVCVDVCMHPILWSTAPSPYTAIGHAQRMMIE